MSVLVEPAPLTVHLLGIPVDLHLRSRQHSDDLLREFALITAGRPEPSAPAERGVPQRLLDLIEQLNRTYAGESAEAELALEKAQASGQATYDLTSTVPAGAAIAARRLAALLDESDEYCRTGEHLLTLATPPDQLRFRRWYLGEFERQAAGHPPTPWSAYVEPDPVG